MLCDAIGGACFDRAVSVRACDVGHAAAREVVVDHVIVHDQRCVQEFERGTNVGGGFGVCATECLVGGHDHTRAKPLAADRVVLEHLPQLHIGRAESGRAVLG